MSRSAKKGPFVHKGLLKKITEMNEKMKNKLSKHGPEVLLFFLNS